MNPPAERLVVEHALARGHVTREQVREALAIAAELRREGREGSLLAVLRARALRPEHAAELAALWRRALPPPVAPGPVVLARAQEALRRAGALDDVVSTYLAPAPAPPAAPPAGAEALRRAAELAPTDVGPPGAPAPAPPVPPPDPAAADVVRAWREAAAGHPDFDPTAEVRLERQDELGRGGMGVVWRVRDDRLRREAALKLLLPELADEDGRARFEREVRLTARLEHPSIPPVYAAGATSRGEPYMLMKLIRGAPLSRRLQEHDWARPVDDAELRWLHEQLEVLVKIGEAVAYAHGQGVVHRDLKPPNVMVGTFGEVLVMDWGLARDLTESEQQERRAQGLLVRRSAWTVEEAAELTQAGTLLGTPGWMAPEQAAGERVDGRADVFALGALLVAVLTGRHPYDARGGALQLVAAAVDDKVVLPRRRRPGLPPELDSIAAAALARDPAGRTASAQAFVADLRAYLAGDLVPSHRYGRRELLKRAVARHPTRVVGAVAAGALLAIAAGVAAWGAGARERAEAAARARAEERRVQEARAARAAAELAMAAAWGRPDLARALAAVQAARRWRDADDGPAAVAAVASAAWRLGDVALEGRQWDLAAHGFEQAGDPDGGRRVADARGAETKARVARAGARLAELRRRLEASPAGAHDELVEAGIDLARHQDHEVVELLCRELGALTAAAPAGLSAAQAGLAKALCGALGRAGEALEPGAPPQAGIERALADYLAAERDAVRAAEAGLALCRLPGAGARRRVLEELVRRGEDGAFGVVARRGLARRPLGHEAPGLDAADYARLGVNLRAQDDFAGALAAFTRAVALDPTRLDLLADRATARAELGDLRGAIDDWSRVLAAQPSAAVHLNRALARRELGDLRGALDDCERALGLEPRLAKARWLGAEVRVLLNDPAAIDDARRAVELDPTDAEAHLALAHARLRAGDAVGARADCERALARDPRLGRAHDLLGHVHRALGDRRALEAFGRAIELAPRVPVHHANRASLRLELGDARGALGDYDRALELGPGQATVWNGRGAARQTLGDLVGARRDFDRALELDPRLQVALVNRAIVRREQGDLVGAAADATAALELGPDATAHLIRGSVRGVLGDVPAALADLERFLELAPEHPNAAEARREIARLRALADR